MLMKLLRRVTLVLSPALTLAAGCDNDSGAVEKLPMSEASAAEDRAASGANAKAERAAPAGESAGKAGSDAPAERARRRLHLPGRTLAGWEPTFYEGLEPLESPPEGYSHLAVVTGRQVGLYAEPGDRWPSGLARTGGRLPARPAAEDYPGCSEGSWYEVSAEHYLCSAEGVHLTEEPFDDEDFRSVTTELQRTRVPRIAQPNLFRHGKAQEGAPFLSGLPDEEELESILEGEVPSELVNLYANGPYILALTDEVEVHGERFFQTIYGSYIRADQVDPRPLSTMHGEWLEGKGDLPLAFSWRTSELYCIEGDVTAACGKVDKHARFSSEGTVERDGRDFVLLSERLAVPREDLRVVTATARPADYAEDDKWIHIDLSEQALLAYEGDEPVFATLVSSGIEGFLTPTGSFRVDRKYNSKTMRGTEPDGRPYQVQEVPWALYYDGNFAAHGAYWHQNFGQPQSHGCVNLPPLDSRWLYHWGDLQLPEGWHAAEGQLGTRVHITGETPKVEEERA